MFTLEFIIYTTVVRSRNFKFPKDDNDDIKRFYKGL